MAKKIDPKNLTVDYKQLLSIPVQDRISLWQSGGQSYFESLTPEQLSRLFPNYYQRQLPDIGKAVSGGTAGTAPSAAARPAAAPTARPATPAPSPAARQSAAPAAGRPAPAPSPAAKPTGTSQTGASNVSPESGYGRANLPINQQQTNQQLPDRSKPEYYSRENIAKRAETTAQNIPAAKAAKKHKDKQI